MSRFTQRQHTARVLEALEGRVKQFRRREELWPLRVPSEPILIDSVVDEALGSEGRGFDADALRTRTLLQLQWDAEAMWEVWMIALPSKTKVYFDSDGHETRILASGGRNEGDENDRVFLQLLAETAGAAFGTSAVLRRSAFLGTSARLLCYPGEISGPTVGDGGGDDLRGLVVVRVQEVRLQRRVARDRRSPSPIRTAARLSTGRRGVAWHRAQVARVIRFIPRRPSSAARRRSASSRHP